jgi:hypothetical protein
VFDLHLVQVVQTAPSRRSGGYLYLKILQPRSNSVEPIGSTQSIRSGRSADDVHAVDRAFTPLSKFAAFACFFCAAQFFDSSLLLEAAMADHVARS